MQTSVHIGIPARNMKRQRTTVKILRCFIRVSGQLSTTPVTKASTLQNSESTPSTYKKCPGVNFVNTWKYNKCQFLSTDNEFLIRLYILLLGMLIYQEPFY